MDTIRLVMQPHDFLQPLLTGDVSFADYGALPIQAEVGNIRTAQTDLGIDASELSLARHVCRAADGDESWVGIPAFVRRGFSHRSWFVRRGSPIQSFADLRQRNVGTNQWLASGNTWSRAVARAGGMAIEEIQWTVGSIDGGPFDRSDDLPEYVAYAPTEEPLADRLADGSIDALMCPDPPALFYHEQSPITRLVPDYRSAERAFYEQTRAFPIHHIVGIRQRLFHEHPECLEQVYGGLVAARKQWSALRLEEGDTSPWLLADLEETIALMGPDWLAYGVESSEETLSYFCREMHEQHLASRAVPLAELFPQFASRPEPALN